MDKKQTEARMIVELVDKDAIDLKNTIRENEFTSNQLKNIYRSEKALNQRESVLEFLKIKINEEGKSNKLKDNSKTTKEREKNRKKSHETNNSSSNNKPKEGEKTHDTTKNKDKEKNENIEDRRTKLIKELKQIHDIEKLRKITLKDLERLKEEKK